MTTCDIHAAPQQLTPRGTISAFFANLARALDVSRTAPERMEELRRLQAMTDTELAALGIARDDLTRHVFGDLFAT